MEYEVRDGGDGSLPVCHDPDSVPGSGVLPQGPENGMKGTTNNTGMPPPPPVFLWLQCAVAVLNAAWSTISQIPRVQKLCCRAWAKKRTAKQTPAVSQDDKAPLDTPEDSSSVASSTVLWNANGTSLERFKNSLSILSMLNRPTTGSCSCTSSC